MSTRRKRGDRQPELFERSTKPVIAIEMNHRLVRLTHELDWTELEEVVEEIRARKLKNAAGRPPHLRALIGAVVFRATRRITYRETEDQIRHYAPVRYLCGLTETEWSPDANTIQDFEELLGEDGMKRLNEYVVMEAVEEKLADPKLLVADTTAQKAVIPYPNEMNLMATFLTAIAAASTTAGGALKAFGATMAAKFAAGKKRPSSMWDWPPQANQMGGARRDERQTGEREGAGRSGNRDGETFEVRLHQAGRPLGAGNGDVRPTRRPRLQPEQVGSRVGKAEQDGARWLMTTARWTGRSHASGPDTVETTRRARGRTAFRRPNFRASSI